MNTKSLSDYNTNIRAAVRKLWAGYGDIYDFMDDMFRVLDSGLEQAWQDGAIVCGVLIEERTPEEQQWLRDFIIEQRQHVFGFGEFIEEHSKANGGALETVFNRAEMWINRYGEVKAKAQLMSCGNSKLEWRFNPAKEHCGDCRRYNGRVHRASVWEKYGIAPRTSSLACRGYRCGCELVPTIKKMTPGKPPLPRGR